MELFKNQVISGVRLHISLKTKRAKLRGRGLNNLFLYLLLGM